MPTINGLPTSVQTVGTTDLLPIDQVVGGVLTTYKVSVGGLFAPLGTAAYQTIPAKGIVWTDGTLLGDVTVGSGLSLSAVGSLTNTGVLAITAGTGITLSGTDTINASGVLAITAGTGISLSGTDTINNSGVLTFGAVTGAVTLGTNLSMTGQTLNATGGGITTLGTLTGPTVALGPGLSVASGSLANSGIVSFGAVTGTVTLGTNLAMSGNTLNATGGGSGITTIGVATGPTIALGTNLSMTGNTLNATGGGSGITTIGTATGPTITLGAGLTQSGNTISTTGGSTAAFVLFNAVANHGGMFDGVF